MCGIAGIFEPNGRPISSQLLRKMNDTLQRRGPDASDIYLGEGVGLGHRRLSIIDVESGQQPMKTEDETLTVVFNGEIYNFNQLRQSLEQKGCRFKTQSDTEVLLHGYKVWGHALPSYLRGMFAFAIWDRLNRKLFLARDRLGIKPLYYAQLSEGSWIFASELKALKAHPNFPSAIHPQAVADYFCYGYIPEPKTIYQDVFKLSPGMWLEIDSSGSKQGQYWDVPALNPEALSEKLWLERASEAIYDSVQARLIAEVPLGAFLSGGVDSSLVVCEMAKAMNSPVTTCSIGFKDAKFDESVYAKQVADALNTNHHCTRVQGHQVPSLKQLIDIYDEPFADSSAIPTLEVCKQARQFVTVALSGDGGDEVFAGYRRYRGHLMEERLRGRIPKPMRKGVFAPLAKYYPRLTRGPRFLRAKSTFESLCFNSVEGYFYNISLFKPVFYSKLFSQSFQSQLGAYHPIEVLMRHARQYEGDCPLNLVQYLDLKTYLPGDILTKVDRASMHHSLEVRVPLLDHNVIAMAQSMPSDLKLKGNQGKYCLKKAYETRLPKEVLYRKKQGFAVPLGDWFRGPLKPEALSLSTSQALLESGIFNPKTLTHIVEEHLNAKADHSAMIWSLCMFESFMRQSLTIEDEDETNARIACA